jgi:hypothetical protein
MAAKEVASAGDRGDDWPLSGWSSLIGNSILRFRLVGDFDRLLGPLWVDAVEKGLVIFGEQ